MQIIKDFNNELIIYSYELARLFRVHHENIIDRTCRVSITFDEEKNFYRLSELRTKAHCFLYFKVTLEGVKNFIFDDLVKDKLDVFDSIYKAFNNMKTSDCPYSSDALVFNSYINYIADQSLAESQGREFDYRNLAGTDQRYNKGFSDPDPDKPAYS